MSTSSLSAYPTAPVHHRMPPLFFYDLGAASKVLLPVAVLPEQFHRPSSRLSTGRGAIALMQAVLEDAIICFQKQFMMNGQRAQRLAREAEEWLFSDDTWWPFSFVNACAALGLEPAYIRQGLIRWRQHRATKPLRKRSRAVLPQRSLKLAA